MTTELEGGRGRGTVNSCNTHHSADALPYPARSEAVGPAIDTVRDLVGAERGVSGGWAGGGGIARS